MSLFVLACLWVVLLRTDHGAVKLKCWIPPMEQATSDTSASPPTSTNTQTQDTPAVPASPTAAVPVAHIKPPLPPSSCQRSYPKASISHYQPKYSWCDRKSATTSAATTHVGPTSVALPTITALCPNSKNWQGAPTLFLPTLPPLLAL